VAEKFESFEKVHEPVPLSFERLHEGQALRFGADEWRVMMGLGHSPEHVCLYSENSSVLISGDHILPRISPNISVSAECPGADPLADYLDSLLPFAELPEDTLVLPSHGLPFQQLHLRIEQLREDHQGNLDKLLSLCQNERSLKQIIPGIFTRKLSPVEYHLAMGESLALVNRLWHLGLLQRRLDDRGVFLYKTG
jgi:glyoxylase-like metal-dependent hydrolase (beta-lactamase superfamily II)